MESELFTTFIHIQSTHFMVLKCVICLLFNSKCSRLVWVEQSRERNVSPDRALYLRFFISSAASLASSLSFSPGLRQLSKQRQKPRSVNGPWLLALELWVFGLFLDETEAGLESLLGSQCGEFPLLPPHNSDTACNSQGNDCGIQEIPLQCCDKFLWILQRLGFLLVT